MRDKPSKLEDSQAGFTLFDLLLGMVFFFPLFAVFDVLKLHHSGLLRYLIGLPLGLALGVGIAWLHLKIDGAMWPGSRTYPERKQTVYAFCLLGLLVLWMVVGAAAAGKLGEELVRHIA